MVRVFKFLLNKIRRKSSKQQDEVTDSSTSPVLQSSEGSKIATVVATTAGTTSVPPASAAASAAAAAAAETTTVAPLPALSTEPESHAIIAAKRFVIEFNRHDLDSLAKTMAPKCIVEFAEAEMLCQAFIDESQNLLKSFPDIHFTYEVVKDVVPNVAIVEKLQVTATHTGDPYGFGPYPRIEAKGCKIKNDREDMTVTIDPETGLITRMKVTAHGRLSGPPGFYEQIGGILF